MKKSIWRIIMATGLVMVLMGAATIPVSANPGLGQVLAGPFSPTGPTGNGRGIAFDGTDLYYTIVGDSNIYKINTAGVLQATISVPFGDPRVSSGGPLAWDGKYLWTVDYAGNGPGGALVLYQVDPNTGATVSSGSVAAANPGHAALAGLTYPDGLHWAGGQLVLSGEISSIGRPTAVVFINPTTFVITSSFTSPGPNDGQWSGVAFDGSTLWHSDPYRTTIEQTDIAGNPTGVNFTTPGLGLEDLEFDSVTFAPKCAVWGNQAAGSNQIAAYEVPCPNTPPDTSQATADPSCLWPPNHKFVPINITGVTDPDGDPVTITVTGVTSDEPTASDEGSGGAKHAPDAIIDGQGNVSVRAERSGDSDGRVYVISFTASDGKGGVSQGSVEVKVPHDQSSDACTAVDSGQNYDATDIN